LITLFFLFDVICSQTLPLKTQSRWVVDNTGHRVKLACVSWYGGESPDFVVGGLQSNSMKNIASLIKSYGFNCVRLPWSNEGYQKNPVVNSTKLLAANTDLVGLNYLTIFDRLIQTLAQDNLFVILDNHVSDANWCCSNTDQNGLWYNTRYTAQSWTNDWTGFVRRYVNQPHVIGADLRNELRESCGFSDGCRTPVWGGGNTNLDWHAAAQSCGNAILAVNPNILIIVEGLSYAGDLKGVSSSPIKLNVANRVVYEAHDYSWFHGSLSSCASLNTALGNSWGYILKQNEPYTAPIWVGEWGSCHTGSDCISGNPGSAGYWFQCFVQYLTSADIDWSWWAIDGTESSGGGRTWGAEETFGILNTRWSSVAYTPLLNALQKIQNATQGP